MKVYISLNHDGNNQAMVVARTLTEAVRRLGTTVGELRRYGWRYATDAEAALATPDFTLYKSLARVTPWSKERHPAREEVRRQPV